jgi:putative transposase
MKKKDKTNYKTYGKNRSLRLDGFDYSTPTVYFLTLCSWRSQDVFSNPKLAEETIKCLEDCSKGFGYRVYAYCLMPDHLHLLLTPVKTGRSVSQYVQTFKSLSTRVFWKSLGKGKLWQRGFYDHIVRKEESLVEIIKYILANPVRKGLSQTPNEYPYSGTPDEITL